MSELASPGIATFPVLVACGACGNVDDLILVLSSSFGLTALLALGQYFFDRARQLLGLRRLSPDMIETAFCSPDICVQSGERTTAPDQDGSDDHHAHEVALEQHALERHTSKVAQAHIAARHWNCQRQTERR